MEWPPRSGTIKSFPEADKAEWFPLAEARAKMLPSQLPILECLEARLAGAPMPAECREVPDAAAQ